MSLKLSISIVCALALLSTSTPVCASEDTDTTSIAVDVVIARPVSFTLTVVGAALFVASLPVTVPSKSVDRVAKALVAAPARDTFLRPVGDLEDFLDY